MDPQLVVWVIHSQRHPILRPRVLVAAAAIHNQIADAKFGSRGIEDKVQRGQRYANDGDDRYHDESDGEKDATAAAAAAATARFLQGDWVPELFYEQRILARRHTVHLVLGELHDVRFLVVAPWWRRQSREGFGRPLHCDASSGRRKLLPCARRVGYATWWFND
ncbi:hypothetical protein V8G54_001262, partial [Vigna mungo]